MVASGNGPDDAVTPASLPAARNCAAVAWPESTVATRGAPCWAANAVSDGEFGLAIAVAGALLPASWAARARTAAALGAG